MPPKATGSGESSTALTVGETTMLAAVVAQLGDIPKIVDFEIVAQICGIKYSRNARTSCKKLFEKIKAAHPEVNITQGGTGSTVAEAAATDDGSADNEGTEAPKSARAAPKKVTKKTVGKTTAPKKASTTSQKAPVKKGTAAKAKAATGGKSDPDDADVEDAEESGSAAKIEAAHAEANAIDLVSGHGRLSGSVTAIEYTGDETSPDQPAQVVAGQSVDHAPATSNGCSSSGQLPIAESSSTSDAIRPIGETLTVATSVAVDALQYFVNEVLYMNINGYDYAYRNQDILDAQSHGITLEQWIIWKFQNGVDRAALCG